MTNKSVNHWFRDILPKNYRRVDGSTTSIKAFLDETLPAQISTLVSVINATEQNIVLAVASPQLATYLRLHIRELQQQIQETFNTSQTLKIKTMPAEKLTIDKPAPPRKPERVSAATVKAMLRNANDTENESLRLALQSLASSLKQK